MAPGTGKGESTHPASGVFDTEQGQTHRMNGYSTVLYLLYTKAQSLAQGISTVSKQPLGGKRNKGLPGLTGAV